MNYARRPGAGLKGIQREQSCVPWPSLLLSMTGKVAKQGGHVSSTELAQHDEKYLILVLQIHLEKDHELCQQRVKIICKPLKSKAHDSDHWSVGYDVMECLDMLWGMVETVTC